MKWADNSKKQDKANKQTKSLQNLELPNKPGDQNLDSKHLNQCHKGYADENCKNTKERDKENTLIRKTSICTKDRY